VQEWWVIDPETGKPKVVITRRRTRRHRRNRMIRRAITAALLTIFTAGISVLALQYFSPSLFRAKQSAPPNFEQAELSRQRVVNLNQMLSAAEPTRPVYPYSVVPGGVEDAKELKWVAEHDPVVAAHYAGFDYDHARVVRLVLARTVYVSYRIGNHVYWTRKRLTLHKGEKVITDGRITARARCANRVEEMPQQAAAPAEPPPQKFDQPARRGDGTAIQGPPVPFQSALLNRPGAPVPGPAGPLSLYTPFSGGSWLQIAPPPLPLNLCSPEKKKITGGKKKKGGCGSSSGGGGTGVVPEPGTWMMVASGLAGLCILARHKTVKSVLSSRFSVLS
jgi:hypothetical protein